MYYTATHEDRTLAQQNDQMPVYTARERTWAQLRESTMRVCSQSMRFVGFVVVLVFFFFLRSQRATFVVCTLCFARRFPLHYDNIDDNGWRPFDHCACIIIKPLARSTAFYLLMAGGHTNTQRIRCTDKTNTRDNDKQMYT